MDLGEIGKEILENISKTIGDEKIIDKSERLTKDEIELAQKLDAIEEFTLDRVEGNIAILEDRKTGKIIEIEKDKLPKGTKEGNILDKINGKFILNIDKTNNISQRISDKMQELWN